MIEYLPREARMIYDDPDLLLRMGQYDKRSHQRNQMIAVTDYLKDKKKDSHAYRLKYQNRTLQELMAVYKKVKEERQRYKQK